MDANEVSFWLSHLQLFVNNVPVTLITTVIKSCFSLSKLFNVETTPESLSTVKNSPLILKNTLEPSGSDPKNFKKKEYLIMGQKAVENQKLL